MRYFHRNTNKYFCPIINIEKIWTLIPDDIKGVPVVDVTKLGYFKVRPECREMCTSTCIYVFFFSLLFLSFRLQVLGKGELPKKQVVVKARFFSKLAEKKIKEAGGACLLTA